MRKKQQQHGIKNQNHYFLTHYPPSNLHYYEHYYNGLLRFLSVRVFLHEFFQTFLSDEIEMRAKREMKTENDEIPCTYTTNKNIQGNPKSFEQNQNFLGYPVILVTTLTNSNSKISPF